jgi:D-glycero-D-manno-heptose 1,7-bisphosphate phosphatase
VVLLDRDGVLNVDLPTGILRRQDLALIPRSAEAVAMLCRAGFRVLVCSNQACVGRGGLAPEELARINGAIDDAVLAAGGEIGTWYICPHRAEAQCDCRKPQPGLLLQAQDEYGFRPAETWFIGDAERDCQAAVAAGCVPILVRTGKGRQSAAQLPAVTAFDDLYQAAEALIVAAQ